MKNIKIQWMVLLALPVMVILSSCNGGPFCMHPKGPNVTQTIDLPAFEGIELTIEGDVTIHKGEMQQVTITGAENIIENIERNVSGGIWKIKFDDCVRKVGDLHIDITIPFLRSAAISGSGSITSTDTFTGLDQLMASISGSGNISLIGNATNVETSISGSGDIRLYTQASNVKSKISGSGDTYLRGTTQSLDAKISGSGNIRAFDLVGETAVVNISGSGDCEVNVSNTLDVTITGSGNVRYKGTPAINTHISGSGNIQHVP